MLSRRFRVSRPLGLAHWGVNHGLVGCFTCKNLVKRPTKACGLVFRVGLVDSPKITASQSKIGLRPSTFCCLFLTRVCYLSFFFVVASFVLGKGNQKGTPAFCLVRASCTKDSHWVFTTSNLTLAACVISQVPGLAASLHFAGAADRLLPRGGEAGGFPQLAHSKPAPCEKAVGGLVTTS